MLFMLEDMAVPYILMATGTWEAGTVKGTEGRSNFMMTVATSFGLILTVSFQPSSVGSGPRAGPI